MKNVSISILFLAVLLCACTRETLLLSPEEERAGREVTLFLAAAPEEGTVKASYSPENETDASVSVEIKNLWILQFDGTTDEALLARSPAYIPNFASGVSSAKLNTDLGGTSTLVFLANTYAPVLSLGTVGETTLGDFKERYMPISAEADLFGFSDGKYYQRLNGSTTATITAETTQIGSLGEKIPLKRSMARLDIQVRSTNASIVLKKVQLFNIPRRDYLYTSYPELASPFPTQTLQVFSYDAESVPDGAGYHLFRHYVPANMRGEGVAETASQKNRESPEGSTYLRVDAEYDSKPVHYFFFLGGNFGGESAGDKTNFDLRPNHRYEYRLTINSAPANDGRVVFLTDVDYAAAGVERANSYMLHVPEETDQYLTFTMPVNKADLFWGDAQYSRMPFSYEGSNDLFVRQYYESKYRAGDMCLGADGEWTVEVLWSDFPIQDGNVKLSADGGVSWGLAQTCSAANRGKDGTYQIKVQGGLKGNFVVGIRKNLNYTNGGSPGTIQSYIWSWHFWITDYNPDLIEGYSAPGSYYFKVHNGKLMRFNTTDAFMMDRPLGAVYDTRLPGFRDYSETAATGNPATGLYYQFGRKDPFPNDRPVYIKGSTTPYTGFYEINSQSAATSTLLEDTRFSKVNLTNLTQTWTALLYTINQRLNIPFSINHPMTYIFTTAGEFWNGGQGNYDSYFNPASVSAGSPVLWMDPKASTRSSTADNDNLGTGKSVFDPCPPGWRVMSDRVDISSWVLAGHISPATYETPLGDHLYHYGSYLWPEEKPADIRESDLDRAMLYVYEGYRLYNSANLANAYNNQNDPQAHVWTAVRTGVSRAYALGIKPGSFTAAPDFQAQGYSVRCTKY